MKIELTHEELRELLDLMHLGGHVRALAREALKEAVGDAEHVIEDTVLSQALAAGVEGVMLSPEGNAIHSDARADELHRLLAEYDDERFWDGLEERLGMRDFERGMTPQDQATIDSTSRMPERVKDLYVRYHEEFETYGVDRLEINHNAPVSDVRDLL